jgi:hypothetical protein
MDEKAHNACKKHISIHKAYSSPFQVPASNLQSVFRKVSNAYCLIPTDSNFNALEWDHMMPF